MAHDEPDDIIHQIHEELDILELTADEYERLTILEKLTNLISELHEAYKERRTDV